MSRIILISSFAALLAASGTQNANAIQSADQNDLARYNQACAEVGIDPGSPIFLQCVTDLDDSLWAVQNLEEN
jgi:hypothetical protein